MSDPQQGAEQLDADKIVPGQHGDDEEVTEVYPPERPQGVLDHGTTANEHAVSEPLAEFVRREEPDPVKEELDRAAEET